MQTRLVRVWPGSGGRLFLRSPTLTASNFAAPESTEPKFSALKDLIFLKTVSKLRGLQHSKGRIYPVKVSYHKLGFVDSQFATTVRCSVYKNNWIRKYHLFHFQEDNVDICPPNLTPNSRNVQFFDSLISKSVTIHQKISRGWIKKSIEFFLTLYEIP